VISREGVKGGWVSYHTRKDKKGGSIPPHLRPRGRTKKGSRPVGTEGGEEKEFQKGKKIVAHASDGAEKGRGSGRGSDTAEKDDSDRIFSEKGEVTRKCKRKREVESCPAR